MRVGRNISYSILGLLDYFRIFNEGGGYLTYKSILHTAFHLVWFNWEITL